MAVFFFAGDCCLSSICSQKHIYSILIAEGKGCRPSSIGNQQQMFT